MSSPLARYESFLIQNVSTISSLESTLRSLTWLLPGRFKDAELVSEACPSIYPSLFWSSSHLFYDSICIAQLPEPIPRHFTQQGSRERTKIQTTAPPQSTLAIHSCLGRHPYSIQMDCQDSRAYPICPTSPRDGASKKSHRTESVESNYAVRSNQVSGSECPIHSILTSYLSHRVVLKFTLLRITRRPLMSSPIPERDIDPESLPPPSNQSSPTLVPSSLGSSPPGTPEHLRNNHEPLPPHPLLTSASPINKTSVVEDFLLSKVLVTSSVKNPTSLVKPLLAPHEWIAESVSILRPFIYG
jgi:peroxin-16